MLEIIPNNYFEQFVAKNTFGPLASPIYSYHFSKFYLASEFLDYVTFTNRYLKF